MRAFWTQQLKGSDIAASQLFGASPPERLGLVYALWKPEEGPSIRAVCQERGGGQQRSSRRVCPQNSWCLPGYLEAVPARIAWKLKEPGGPHPRQLGVVSADHPSSVSVECHQILGDFLWGLPVAKVDDNLLLAPWNLVGCFEGDGGT